MAISKPFNSVSSLSTGSNDSNQKRSLPSKFQYLGILRNGFNFCRSGLSKPMRRKHSLSTWRPATLSPFLLASVTIFNAAVITVLGILQWKSNRDGGLYFSETIDDIPTGVTFLHLHFPTMIAVAYSVVWSWIDLDVKRLEPWFRMSQTNGAEARDSVLLHYPVDFIASVPLNAAKRRHWAVVSVSAITVAIFWAVTPLQSAIFAVDTISLSRPVPVTVSDSLIPLEQQADKLNTGFLNDGYAVLWLGQDLPPFTTMNSTLAPLRIPDYQPIIGQNKTITYPTRRFETTLNCYPPASMETTEALGITADNGRGCVAKEVLTWYERNTSVPFKASYIGYFDDPYASYSLALAGCPKNASNSFLAVWRYASLYPPNFDDPSNATALFCEPSYSVQSVDATVTFPGYSVVEVNPTGPRTTISNDTFKMDRFHYILGTGAQPRMYEDADAQQDAPNPADIAERAILYQNSKLENASIELPASNMVGFAIGSSKLSPEQYLNASKLSSSFEAAHQLLFALAAHDLMTTPAESNFQSFGDEAYTVQAVTLVQTFTFLVQAFLVLIVALTLFFILSTRKRRINLTNDPNSMSEIMSLSTSTRLLKIFQPLDSLGSDELAATIRNTPFKVLREDTILGSRGIHALEESPQGASTVHVEPACPATPQENRKKRPTVQPLELRTPVGIVFVCCLIASLVAILLLKQKIVRDQGLPLPSRNHLVEQILTNFLPTGLATFMEPWWVVLNRLACLLQPYKELRRGHSPSQKSLSVKYTSLPPQLLFWRAMKAGHLLLVVVSFTGLLSNILTVSLSGLFIRKTITVGEPTEFSQLYQLRFPNGFTEPVLGEYEKRDHYQVAMTNISSNTSLPPWVSPKYYYLPVNLSSSHTHNDGNGDVDPEYQLNTTGIGADLDCLELVEAGSDHTYEFNVSRDATGFTFSTFHKNDDGSLLQCDGVGPVHWSQDNSISSIFGKADGRRALELWPEMSPSPEHRNSSHAEYCTNSLVGGWVRANLTELPGNVSVSRNEYRNVSINSMDKLFLSCRPKLKSAQFNARVDATGRIIDATQIGPFNNTVEGNVNYIAFLVSDFARRTQDIIWHNNSLSADWTNHLIKLKARSDDILNPTTPVPEFNSTAEILKDIYTRLFAIRLSLHSEDLVPAAQNPPSIAGYRNTEEPRLFFSEPMFILSVVIFVIDILVALAIYIGFWKPFLPRLPTTIASNIATFAASHIPELLRDNPERSGEAKMALLDKQGYRYGLGEFVGTDGNNHFGIDRDPFVASENNKSKVRRRVKEWVREMT